LRHTIGGGGEGAEGGGGLAKTHVPAADGSVLTGNAKVGSWPKA